MKKTLSETVLYKLVGTFSMKDLQHSTPDLTFLKEIAERISKDYPKGREEKKQKGQKGRNKEKEEAKGRGCWEIPDEDQELKTDFTVGCTVVTRAAKQKTSYDGQKGRVEQVLSHHLKKNCRPQDRVRLTRA